MTDGTARAWGTAARGARTDTLSGVTHVSCGHSICVALMTNGRIQMWGTFNDEPTNWEDLEDVVDAFCIDTNCVVRTKNGTAYVWGTSWYKTTKTLTNVVDISCSAYACVALKNDGSAVGWGYNGDTSDVDLSKNVIYVTCGGACVAIMNDTSIQAWGVDDRGGIEPTLSDVVRVSCGPLLCFAIMDNGTAAVWGDNDYGGDITCEQSVRDDCSPLQNGVTLTDVADIVCGSYACVVLKNNGNAFAWGQAGKGGDITCNKADSTHECSPLPEGITLTNVTGISCTKTACVALKTDGTIHTWGDSAYGGDVTCASSTAVSTGTNLVCKPLSTTLGKVFAVTCGATQCVALMQDGSIEGWGDVNRGANPPQLSNIDVRIGSYRNADWNLDRSQDLCIQCPLGRYQNETNQISCKDCPSGRSTLLPGSIAEECFTTNEIRDKFVDRPDPTLVPAYNIAKTCTNN